MEMAGWENLLLGVLVLMVILWMWPGIKTTLARSREAESDWAGLLMPIGLVVIFVIFLISMV